MLKDLPIIQTSMYFMQQQMCAAQSTAYFHIGHAMLASLNILAVLSLTFWYGVQDEYN